MDTSYYTKSKIHFDISDLYSSSMTSLTQEEERKLKKYFNKTFKEDQDLKEKRRMGEKGNMKWDYLSKKNLLRSIGVNMRVD